MILGAMQPYFFPYLGYFDLINRSDRWVVFDVVKYAPRSWMNRNRILHPTTGWQYVGVPVDRRTEGNRLDAVRVIDGQAARRKMLGQIEHYRRGRAPHYEAVRGLIEDSFRGFDQGLLRDLNVAGLAATCAYLGIRFDPVILSQSDIVLPPIDHAGQWALEISTALGADHYVNPPNGRGLFDAAAFAARGIRLSFTDVADFRYACGRYDFVERLSILDVLMWNTPQAVRGYLDDLNTAAPT